MTLEMRVGPDVKLTIDRAHADYPGEWMMTFGTFLVDAPLMLPAIADIEKAQERAVFMARDLLLDLLVALGGR